MTVPGRRAHCRGAGLQRPDALRGHLLITADRGIAGVGAYCGESTVPTVACIRVSPPPSSLLEPLGVCVYIQRLSVSLKLETSVQRLQGAI